MATPGFGRRVLAPQNRIRIVAGRVSAASAIVSGTGFTVADTGTGVDTITWDDKPKRVVSFTANKEGTGGVGLAAAIEVNYSSAPTSVIVSNGDGSSAADASYSFLAVLEY